MTKFSYTTLFFTHLLKNQLFFSRFINLKKNSKVPQYFFKNFEVKSPINLYVKHINKYHFCTSKLWVLRYGSWIILSIAIFDLGNKFLKKKKRIRKNYKLLLKKKVFEYNVVSFKNLFRRSRKNKKLLVKKVLNRLKKFFKFKNLGDAVLNRSSCAGVRTEKLFKKFLKKRLKRHYTKRKLFKRTFLNTKISKFFKKKERILKNTLDVKLAVQKEVYSFF